MAAKAGKQEGLWERDDIQFSRLISEINAVGLTEIQKKHLAESMDVSADELWSLLRRAELRFMELKARYLNEDRSRCYNCCKIWLDADLSVARDLHERTEPGGTIPSGECPKCGALTYPVKRRRKR